MIDFLIDIDTQLIVLLNSLHTSWLDTAMWYISATITWIPLYVGIIYYFFKTNTWKQALLMLLAVIVSVALADFISVACFKNVFCRLRPSHTPAIQDILHYVRGYRGGEFGFVSSHAANCFAIATITSLLIPNRKFRILLFVWAAIVAYSRIYLGVHFPADVLGGAIVGSLLSFIVFRLYKLLPENQPKN